MNIVCIRKNAYYVQYTVVKLYFIPNITLVTHHLWEKWKWPDVQPSMVTHTQNSCSAFNPSKVHTHSSEHTHTVNTNTEQWTHTQQWTHTWSSGLPFMLRRPGSSWGFGALLKGTSVVVLRVERVLDILSPHLQFLQPLGYESDSLTIRPRLPQKVHTGNLINTSKSNNTVMMHLTLCW